MHNERFSGYQNTPLLWKGNIRNDIPKPFYLPDLEETTYCFNENIRLRLGNLVEQFFFSQLRQVDSIETLATNIQVKHDKITIGEVDCILNNNGHYEHIEVVYKFYLYDEIDSTNELVNWIGPNRKDSLVEKLDKLANKQFPLIEREETKEVLASLAISSTRSIVQFTYFKAQLFIPYQTTVNFQKINESCVAGIYVNLKELHDFKDHAFYIPEKLDWLCKPKADVNYKDFSPFLLELEQWLSKEKSPMCWMKSKSGTLSKLFVVWW